MCLLLGLQPTLFLQKLLSMLTPPRAQVVIGLGLLAATGYAIKEYLAPRVAHWLADWRASSDAAESARAAAEAKREKSTAAIAAAIAAQARPPCSAAVSQTCFTATDVQLMASSASRVSMRLTAPSWCWRMGGVASPHGVATERQNLHWCCL